MQTTETTRSPSVLKAAAVFAATAAMLVLSSRAPAQEFAPTPRAYAGQPSVRIRGVDSHGLTPVAFADGIAAHRDIRGSRNAALFIQADANGDGRVSAVELKDLLIVLAKA
ncbi:MAG: hypothetical protein EON57_05240 [Alphaproteobacteria bacterium]|nr:MAG: hypothetical protein EON57_05240 [Alphaproteobacteria bacterium]